MDLFWPDALFWGTTSPELATTSEAVRGSFAPMATRFRPDERRASALETSALVASDDVVLISGLWQIEATVNGSPSRTPFRVSMAVTRRGGTWRIAQFHNSPRPSQ